MPMASTTKIMTCFVAIKDGALYDEVVIPREATGVEGSSVYLQAGEQIKLIDLLYALMLESANDAAVAIAIAVSGSEDAFVQKMNETAVGLNLLHTHFNDPHGLSSDGHYSSAKDLCLLLQAAMKDEIFASITAEKSYKIPAPDNGTRVLINHNRLLRTYEECIGGKTGFTKASGRCLVTAAKHADKTLICATLNDPDDWNDHKALYQDGFSMYQEVSFCQIGEIQLDLPVVGGEINSVPVRNFTGCSGLVRGTAPIQTIFEAPRFLYAPVPGIEVATDGTFYLRRAGVSVGSAVFCQDGREVGRVPLYPVMNIGAAAHKKGFFERIGDWFRSLWDRIKRLWN